MPAGAEPLHLGAFLSHSQGRWNRKGQYAALYTALTEAGARAEWRRLVELAGSAVGPRELVSIDVSVEPLLDLTDLENYQDLCTRARLIPQTGFLSALAGVGHEHCQRLADQARKERYTALLVPSAAAPGEVNLVVYADVVAPKQIVLANGPDRVGLTV